MRISLFFLVLGLASSAFAVDFNLVDCAFNSHKRIVIDVRAGTYKKNGLASPVKSITKRGNTVRVDMRTEQNKREFRAYDTVVLEITAPRMVPLGSKVNGFVTEFDNSGFTVSHSKLCTFWR